MIEVVAGFVVFVIAMLLMAVGVLAGRPAIRGSCGGLAFLPGQEQDCIAGCTRPCPRKSGRSRVAADVP